MKTFRANPLPYLALVSMIHGGLAAQNVPVLPPGAPPVVPSTAPPAASSGKNVIGFTATPLSEVLSEYFRVTGRKVLRDRGLENTTVTIDVPGEFSDEEYRSIIEKGLLMHGFALVPSGANLFKLVATEMGTVPSSQGVPMILLPQDLPESDQVVTHVLQLVHLSPDDASTAFQQLIPLHPYGKMLAVPNSQSLVITEASQTIRAFLDLAKQVDQPPMAMVSKTIKLQRATAEEAVDQLSALLGIGSSGASGGGSGSGAPSRPASAPPVPGQAAAGSSATLGSSTPDNAKPILQAITRTNSIIIMARPVDMRKIETLVAELDAESSSTRYFSRRLNYLDLTVFLGIAEKALLRNDPKAASRTGALGQNTSGSTTNNNNGSLPSSGSTSPFGGSTSGFGSSTGTGSSLGSSGGLGGSSLSGSGGGLSSPLSNTPRLDVTKKAISVLIANTLVIADPASSKFFASGPPDQIQALQELAEELDVRPRQILLSATIGQFTLTDDFNFGLDWIQSLKQVGSDGLVGGVLNTQGTAFANPSSLQDIAGFLATGGPATIGGLTTYGQINKNLNVFLQTLEKTKKFHVLQKPTITTLNHQSATIYIGQQLAIAGQTYTSGAGAVGGLGFTSTTQYIPIRLQLQIVPHIFNEREVMLEFTQQNNDVSGFTTISGNQVPNITEQGMSNSLIVGDHATAMLGGLITERDNDAKSGLPFLMRLPLVKYLFGSTTKNKSRLEMMIFVQPSILPDEATYKLEQAKFGDYSANFVQGAEFAGMPEIAVPNAIPANSANKPNALLPPATGEPAEPAPKKGFFSKVKGLFQKSKPPAQ